MRAAAAAPQAWGRAWHTPTNPPRTQRQAIADMAEAAGVLQVAVKGMSRRMLSAAGLFIPLVRELKETYYQFEAPFVIDDSATRLELHLEATAWKNVVNENLAPFLAAATN